MIGLPQNVDDVDKRALVEDRNVQVVEVMPDSPAEKAGIKMADLILSVDGNNINSDQELQEITSTQAGQALTYKIKRGGKTITKEIIPEKNQENEGRIGIAISNTGLVKYPWYLSIWKGIKNSILMLWFIIVAFFQLIKGLFVGQGVASGVSGPIGIAVMTGRFAEMGVVYLVQFTALLSLNLAVINFLPFPALDGGRVIFLLIEKIKGSPVKKEVEAMIHNTGFLLLLLLILVVTIKDVSQYAGKFVDLWEKIF